MAEPDVVIFVCHGSLSPAASTASPKRRANAVPHGPNVAIREVPCSGKIDVIYLLKVFEGGARGVAVITCPLGQCRLVEGNYRAQVRVEHVGDLLDEAGLGRDRLVLLRAAEGEEGRDVPGLIEQAIERLSAMPESPLRQKSEAVGAKGT